MEKRALICVAGLDDNNKIFRRSTHWLKESGFNPHLYPSNWGDMDEGLGTKIDILTRNIAATKFEATTDSVLPPEIYILALSAGVSLALNAYAELNDPYIQERLGLSANPVTAIVGISGRVTTTEGFTRGKDSLVRDYPVYYDSVDLFEKVNQEKLRPEDLRKIAIWGSTGDGIAPDKTTVLPGAFHYTIKGRSHMKAVNHVLANAVDRVIITDFLRSR